ncbi:MAG: pilus assembly protein [Bdellovibrionaceae bacterium]|nr:pilus assembly protein [Bdellovibrionales bacterium]MCB9254116.1 pilus assembly protein [Pseudobdellovibrionaceae bacterium]
MGNFRGYIARRRTRAESGQVAILFALVFTFMFILFMFVVDFGHLINNKINLQLAADAAAYAGAAQQARILNRIAMVNYRLRQNLKEFAMRANVTHLRHNRNFPRGAGVPHGRNATELFICQQAHGYRALSGLTYARDTNLCRNASPSVGGLPPIVIPPVIATFDPFAIAIQAQIGRIQQAANQECRAAANDNRILAQYLVNAYTRRSAFFDRQIAGLEDFMNQVNGITDGEGADHPVVAAAYQSALRNLTRSNTRGFRLEILQPDGGQFLTLNRRTIRGTLFFFDFQVEGNGCVGRPNFIDFNNMVAGYSKEQGIVTWFGVKAVSQPNLFFMPSKWVEAGFPELTAVATAKPFGSRIGPEITADILAPIANRPGNNSQLLNFSVRPNDTLGIADAKLMAFYDSLHPFNNIGRPQGNRQLGWPLPRPGTVAPAAMVAIRSPTIFDAAFYTVFPDVGGNANTDYLEPNFANALYPDYMQTFDSNGNQLNPGTPAASPYFQGIPGSSNGFVQMNAIGEDAPGSGYTGYVTEGNNAHSVTTALVLGGAVNENNANDLGFATPQQVHSAWAPRNGQPRIGYSVKFIGMDALTRTLEVTTSDGATGRIQNPPVGDPDFERIFH